MEVTIAKTIEIPQLSMGKEEAMINFGFRNHKRTFQDLLKEFKEHPEFGKGYNLVTYKVLLINVEDFDNFLKWRGKNKFKLEKNK